jgi:hypothetical protein
MPAVAIGVVAHPRRELMANELAAQVGAEVISWDTDRIGAERNHLRVWEWLADSSAEWGVVLEDDVIPCPGFHRNLTQATAHAPTPIISLYLGRGRCAGHSPLYQQWIAQVITRDVSFITSPSLLSAQGYAMRPEMFARHKEVCGFAFHSGRRNIPIDEAVSVWLTKHRLGYVSYCRHSVVDHRDGPTLVTDHRDRGAKRDGRTQLMAPDCDPSGAVFPEIRRAWLTAVPDTDWTKGWVAL